MTQCTLKQHWLNRFPSKTTPQCQQFVRNYGYDFYIDTFQYNSLFVPITVLQQICPATTINHQQPSLTSCPEAPLPGCSFSAFRSQVWKELICSGAVNASTSCCLPFCRRGGLGRRQLTRHLSSVLSRMLTINLDANKQKKLKKQRETKLRNKKPCKPLSTEHHSFLQANVSWAYFSVDVESWGWSNKSAELSKFFEKP